MVNAMTTWNYRVIRKTCPNGGQFTYQIHEVYYRDDGSIDCWTQAPVEPLGISEPQLRNDVHAFLAAFRMPVLEEKMVRGQALLVEERIPGQRSAALQQDYSSLANRASGYLFQVLGSHLLLKQEPELRQAYDRVDQALAELCELAARKPAHQTTAAA
jgi:hypothetical protein